MIVVDSSVWIAILLDEPEATALQTVLATADRVATSALTVFETRAVLLRRLGASILPDFETLLAVFEVESIPFDAAAADLATEAYRRFGRGSGHPAALNFGDCAAYAAAVGRGAPLLFKGEDFGSTDVPRVEAALKTPRSGA